MSDFDFSTGMPSDEMSEYLQMYLDETSEQLDALVETLLVLEDEPTHAPQLNEAFRLVHSVKGSSAMMGLDSITILTHHLENHFERLRSGLVTLDQGMMDVILRCIDFLRECNARLRARQPLGSAPQLLEELNSLNSGVPDPRPRVQPRSHHESPAPPVEQVLSEPVSAPAEPRSTSPPSRPVRSYWVHVQFEPDLQLADLKAELVLGRLADLGVVHQTHPSRNQWDRIQLLNSLEIVLSSDRAPADIRAAANLDGIDWIEIEEGAAAREPADDGSGLSTGTKGEEAPEVLETFENASSPQVPAAEVAAQPQVRSEPTREELAPVASAQPGPPGREPPAAQSMPGDVEAKSKVAETVRVDIERLDNLMNLAGELVVNKARFVQIARQMSPGFRKSGLSGRARAFGDAMRRAMQFLKGQPRDVAALGNGTVTWGEQIHELEAELAVIEEQSRIWEESRRCFGQITEAIDQLTRVSDSLQRGVLDTRMVPVAPLFNRFKRVVRDISQELGKKVQLEIHGEKTELDKRMIDELGDPLVHLVRNAIDHGIEPAEVRARRGKPDVGTLRLSATHRGNNVFVSVSDDGGGIHVDKVRQRIVERGLVPAAAAEALSARDVIDFIWHPGFSTADTVSDISGRGVGMDIVKTRIAELNGTIDIEHVSGQGATFTIRLPLTLAIIRSLLFRLRHGVFAVPIDNVREIVSVPVRQIVTIRGKQTFDVRGEFLPLVDIDDIFSWHNVEYRHARHSRVGEEEDAQRVDVVVLYSANKAMGLKVNELHGSQDIVIKSLAENFVHIRGLSGASILGDGSVCLLLDVAAVIDMAATTRGKGLLLENVG